MEIPTPLINNWTYDMKNNNYYNLLKTNLKLILKFLFQSVCMLMMIYHITIVTMDFFAFPTEVSVDVIEEENYTLPSRVTKRPGLTGIVPELTLHVPCPGVTQSGTQNVPE